MPKKHSMLMSHGGIFAIGLAFAGTLMYIIALNLSLHSMSLSVEGSKYELRADVYLMSVGWTGDSKVWGALAKEAGKADTKFHTGIKRNFVDGESVASADVLTYVCAKQMKTLWPGACGYFGKLQVIGLLLVTCVVLNAVLAQGIACYKIFKHGTSKPVETRKASFCAILSISLVVMLVLVVLYSVSLHSWSDEEAVLDTDHSHGLSPGELVLCLGLACQAAQLVVAVLATRTFEEAMEEWEAKQNSQQGGYGAMAVNVPIAVGVAPPVMASSMMVTETTYSTSSPAMSPVMTRGPVPYF
uniref:Uncharacterized protein n=1 Tax=Zooxanthella nutricula TaxID=1333877 RepID=A0A6U6SS12_9DINO|mmetsp:Transcript_77392/g.236880  ORF Transcript_77392/g.236880 Transcript_77392/m.236880 type:complete len:300 (+) Transcript_77392:97-996(+)